MSAIAKEVGTVGTHTVAPFSGYGLVRFSESRTGEVDTHIRVPLEMLAHEPERYHS